MAPVPLWKDAAFRAFVLARTISTFGSALSAVALPLLIFRQTQSALQTGILTALGVVPYLLFGLLAGALSDRMDRRQLMIGCDLACAVLLLSIPLVNVALGSTPVWQVYLVAVCSATLFVWFDAASFGALPALVGSVRIVEANSIIWSGTTLLSMVGPAIAGLLVAAFGPAVVLGIDGLSYLLSGLILLRLPRRLQQAREPQSAPQSLGQDIRSGLQFLWNHPLIRTLTVLGFGMSFVGGAVTALLVVYAVRVLGLTTTDARIGWLYTATAIGALCATFVLPRLGRLSPTWVSLWGYLLVPLPLLGLALCSSLSVALLYLFVWQSLYTLVVINGISVRQQQTPDELQGRVNTIARMVAWGGTPFGALLAGLLAEHLDMRLVLLSCVGIAALSALGAWTSSLREIQVD